MDNLIEAIKQLKKEKNAIILGHYYQKGEIQDIADYVGDSLALAQWAARTEADIIVMCGVHFMGETAKVLCPDKKVLVPDMAAGCSLADSCPADKFSQFVKEHPGYTVISYVNTTAAVKAVTDVVVTSTNAKQIVESFPKDEKIIFGPDRNLGNYINSITGRNMLLWDGACHVHEEFSVEKIVEIKTAASRCGGTGTSRMQEYSLETGRCGRLYGSFAEVRSGTSRKELHCSYRKRYPARDAETMPADNIYSGSSQRQHLCLQ